MYEAHSTNASNTYDGLTAYVAMVMLLAVSKRDNEDERTLGELAQAGYSK